MRTRWYLLLVVALVLLLASCILACGKDGDRPPSAPPMPEPEPEYVHYVNEEFEFSLDYPKGWLLEEVNPNEVGIRPKDSEYNQIQIGAYEAEPIIGVYEESFIVSSHKASLQQFFDMMGASDLEILVNERASGMWDWVVSFTVIYEDTPLQGGELIKERYISEDEFLVYSLFYMYSMDWPDGLKVIDSFTITG